MRFLRGSKALFLLSMAASVLSALCDMLSPQIVRVAVDNALGGAAPTSLPGWAVALAERCGGFAWLGEHIWVLAAALILVALVKAAAQYGYRVSNTLSRPPGTACTRTSSACPTPGTCSTGPATSSSAAHPTLTR